MKLFSMNKKTRNIFTAIVVVILIVAGFSYISYFSNNSSINKSTKIFGPKVSISLATGLNYKQNATETVQIMGINSSYVYAATGNGMKINPQINITNTSTGPYVILFEKSYNLTNSTNNRIVFLGENFIKLANGWKKELHDYKNQTVSITVESQLSIPNGKNVSIYTYYNNILYILGSMNLITLSNLSPYRNWFNNTSINPSNYSTVNFIPYSFNVTPLFDLSHPNMVIPQNNSSSLAVSQASERIAPNYQISPPCDPGTYYFPVSYRTLYGPIPLEMVHITDIYNGSVKYPILLLSEGIVISCVTISFNSAQITKTTGGTYYSQMSTTPSKNFTGNFVTATGRIATWLSVATNASFEGNLTNISQSMAMIYISNATYSIVHYDIYHVWGYGNEGSSTCHMEYVGNATSVSIEAINKTNGNFTLGYKWMPEELFYFMKNLSSGVQPVNLGNLQPGGEMQSSNIWAESTGYSNAASVYSKVVNAAATISTSLGVGLGVICLMAAMNGIDWDAEEPAVVLAATALATSIIGYVSSFLLDLNSISYSVSSNFGGELYDLTSSPLAPTSYSYQIFDYQSMIQTDFSINGGTYSFNSPSNFLVAT